MLFNVFNPRVIPHLGIDRNNPYKDYSQVDKILGQHSEVPRPEYDYTWNSDGLRSIELATKPLLMGLGCSITLGQGLPVWGRWTDILTGLTGQPVANLAYSGAAANKLVSSFMGATHQYSYKPKTVVAYFANFERFYFIDGYGSGLRDWYANHKPKKTKATAPWDYEEILPYEWVYYNNLDHIKMLEAYCEAAGINLIWSCWSTTLTDEQEQFLNTNFKNYVPDPVRWQFPSNFETGCFVDSPDELKPLFEMKNWPGCHADYKEKHPEIFDYAYDYHKIAGDWGPGAHWPHPGLHWQLHIAEFFHNQLCERGWL
jgi:hypothetical protein